MTKTEEIIAGMLTEDTGRHFLDSGGANGRNFQRNQGRDFSKEESTVLKFEVWNGRLDISMTHNLYHWLVNRLKFDKAMDDIFHGAYIKKNGTRKPTFYLGMDIRERLTRGEEKNYFELAAEFPQWVAEHVSIEDSSILGNAPPSPIFPKEPIKNHSGKTRKARKLENIKYNKALSNYKKKFAKYYKDVIRFAEHKELLCDITGPYRESPITNNTYNGEDMLSQVIQFTYFRWNGEYYVVLMVHGGADIRGGYTTPRVFTIDHDDETAIFDNAQGNIYCTGKDHHPSALKLKEFQAAQKTLPGINVKTIDFDNCGASWHTDDSCNFYDSEGYCDSVNLEDREFIDLQKEIDESGSKDQVLEFDSLEPGSWRPGVLCILDGKGYCPNCGGLLAGAE
jgi:hypothetical protein